MLPGVISPYQAKFDEICRLARAKDEAGLRAYLDAEGLSASLCIKGVKPVTVLALEDNGDAVTFLLERFQANINDVLDTYAQKGNVAKVDALLDQGRTDINYALCGYTLMGHDAEAEDLLRRGANINYAAYGYARAGNVAMVDEMLRRGATLNYALQGYASTGRVDEVNDLLRRGNENEKCLNSAVLGYAQAGCIQQVEDLLMRGANINAAIEGYAHGGHVTRVYDLLRRGASILIAALGYAEEGYTAHVEDLLNGVVEDNLAELLDHAILGYARAHNVPEVEKLLLRGADSNRAAQGYAQRCGTKHLDSLIRRGASIECALQGFFDLGYMQNDNQFLRILSFVDNLHDRNKYVELARVRAPLLVDPNILQRADRIHRGMQAFYLNYAQAKTLTKQDVGTWTWLLQGMHAIPLPNLAKKRKRTVSVSPLVYALVTSHLLAIPIKDTDKIRKTVNAMVFGGISTTLFTKLKCGLFSAKEYKAKLDRASSRFVERDETYNRITITSPP